MRGAGPVAVMTLLEGGEKYGYELVKLLERQKKGVLAMGQSTLYPMLYNLEAKGWVVRVASKSASSSALSHTGTESTTDGPGVGGQISGTFTRGAGSALAARHLSQTLIGWSAVAPA